MPFRLRKDTRTWFRDIADQFSLDFDMYQLCLLAGLGAGRKVQVPDDETTVLVENFPGEYKGTGRIIIAFFLSVELESLGIRRDDRQSLHSTISSLVEPQSASQLSSEGQKAMNQYSFAGFDVITEWFESRPHTFGAFFPVYKQRLDESLMQLQLDPL